MANRAYLYSGNNDLTRLRDLSESRHPIPLTYKIVLGCNTELVDSRIWKYEHPIAIKGDFKAGIEKLLSFLDYLQTQELDSSKLESFRKETKEFFSENPDRELDVFFLEAGEIFDLTGDIDPIEEQNRWLFDEIKRISHEIDQILETKPENVFASFDSYWLKELKSDIDLLSPYWTHVTYFSFNNS